MDQRSSAADRVDVDSASESIGNSEDICTSSLNENLNAKPKVHFPWLPFIVCLVLLAGTLWIYTCEGIEAPASRPLLTSSRRERRWSSFFAPTAARVAKASRVPGS